jgi:hypothetical protein
MGHRRGPDEQSSMCGKWYSLPSSPALHRVRFTSPPVTLDLHFWIEQVPPWLGLFV